MEHKIKARLEWVKLHEITKDAGRICRRCGISRPTLRKWWRRFQAKGEAGLRDRSRGRTVRLPERFLKKNSIGLRIYKLQDWQDYYNEFRPHGFLNGKTPWERRNDLFMKRLIKDEVKAAFDSKERLRLQNYRDDLYWQKLKLTL